MSATLQALPIEWIKKIFQRFNSVYGPALMRGTWGDDESALMDAWEVWAQELAGFKNYPDAIKYALEHLPIDYPPNLLQFREICRDGMRGSQLNQPMLEHKQTPAEKHVAEKYLAQIKELVSNKKWT